MPTIPTWLYQLIGLCVVGCLAFAAKWWTAMDTPDGLAKLRATSPRLAAFVSIVDGLGINVPQILNGLLVLFKGKWPARLIGPLAGLTMLALVALPGCSLWSSIKPVLTADAEKFAACVYANLPEAIGDLVTLNAADAEQLALKCGGTAIDGATVQSMAGDKAKAKAAAASHAAPAASASAK
jgi:hypothetical protein